MPTRGDESGRRLEPRWPASCAVVVALVLYVTLPNTLTLGPWWVLPALEAALVVPLTIRAPYRHPEEVRLIRAASFLLIALVTLATIGSLARLVLLVLSSGPVSGRQLIFSGVQIWMTLVLVFALWYWELDRGGPVRGSEDQAPDFLFPQMATPELHQPDWKPVFADYLFVAFTGATAFSPTDTLPLTVRAKALMMAESLCAIVTVVMVAGRAVNILH